MQYLHPSDFQIAEARVIDWYDGIVSGLLRLQSFQKWFFVSLLAWNQQADRKVFAVFELAESQSDRLMHLLSNGEEGETERRWKDIQDEIKVLRESLQGRIILVECRDIDSPISSTSEIDIDQKGIREQIGQSVEQALSANRIETWFGHLGLTE